MIPFLGFEHLTANYARIYWGWDDGLYGYLNDGYDIVTEDGVSPLRRVVAKRDDGEPVFAYLLAAR